MSEQRLRVNTDCDYVGHVRRLLRLEFLLGRQVNYNLLDPAALIPITDDVGLQTAARLVRDFLGLRSLIIVVGRAKQNEGVAGHIELRCSPEEVFIEISPEVSSRPDDAIATIAHEITHQYLELNGFPATDGPEYEVFTDTAAIFLGLGKLILNGSNRVGYLGQRNAALVYLLCCAMREIPEERYILGLNEDVAVTLQQVKRTYAAILDERFFSNQIEGNLVERA